MKATFKRYVDQIIQNVIALLNICGTASHRNLRVVHQYLYLVPDYVKCIKNDCYFTALLAVLNFKYPMVSYSCNVFFRCIVINYEELGVNWDASPVPLSGHTFVLFLHVLY